MKFKESATVELKRKIIPDLKKEVIAFANSKGGTLYIGIEDNGEVIGIEAPDKDALQISNMLRDAIKPDIMMFVDITIEMIDDKNILVITVQRGTERPYYIREKGLRPEGVYVRQGTSSVPATESAIRQMIKETDGDQYEEMRSLQQHLTFTNAEVEFASRNLAFGRNQMKTLGMLNSDGLYTNLGLLLSDQCVHTVKVAAFEGITKMVFKDRHEFQGSLLKQLSEVYDYIDRYNRVRAEFSGLRRIDLRDYPEAAVREALINSIVHRDYALGGSTLISLFEDRMEFVSIGGLIKGLTLDDIMLGVSLPRNERLANIFYRLELIEAYGLGMQKIFSSYEDTPVTPQVEITDNAFKIILPNTNIMAEQYALSENEKTVLELFTTRNSISRADVETMLSISQSMSIRLLKQLTDKRLIKPIGNGKNRKYIKDK